MSYVWDTDDPLFHQKQTNVKFQLELYITGLVYNLIIGQNNILVDKIALGRFDHVNLIPGGHYIHLLPF